MSYIYTTQPHPTCKGKLLAIAPKPESWRCLTETERAFYAIGGTHWRGHQEPGTVAYTLSQPQARDLDLILRAGFRSSCQPYNGRTEEEDRTFWHPDYPAECGAVGGFRDFTRAEALEIAGHQPRCKRTAEMDFDAPTEGIEPSPPTCDTKADQPAYSISPARYANGKMIVRCPSNTGYKTRAAYLIGDGLNCRYSGRSGGYVASPAQVERFERLYAAGFDASAFTGEMDCRELGLDRLDWRTADKVARWIEVQPNAWAILEMLRDGETVADIGQLEPEAKPALAALEKAGWLISWKQHWANVGRRTMHWQRVGAAMSACAPEAAQERVEAVEATPHTPEPVSCSYGPEIGSGVVTEESRDMLDAQGEAMAAFIETLEPLPAVSVGTPTARAKRTPAHERAIRRAWAERRERRALERRNVYLAARRAEAVRKATKQRSRYLNLSERYGALAAASEKWEALRWEQWDKRRRAVLKAREMQAELREAIRCRDALRADCHEWEALQHRTWTESMGHKAKRRRSTLLARQRGKGLVAMHNVARARLDELQADLAKARQAPTYFDDTGMERRDAAAVAFDQGRHALDKAEKLERQLTEANAKVGRQQAAIKQLSDELVAMGSRAIKAERALAAVTARRAGWPPAVRAVNVQFSLAG